MHQGRSNRISDIFQRALAHPAAERERFLQEVCGGDDALREDVESLLRFEPASDGFLERPAIAIVAQGPQPRAEMIGRALGPYTITAALGVGGMGEVYRARDSKLGREVAIKILPLHFTEDAERRVRFAREARVLATLNHPNIGAIYGVEEADGLTGLVLELVDGQTLAARLERGPMPLADALGVARQVAEALAAAHEKGIVHRDLKPSNIVLQAGTGITSSDLRVKVLDFGLAKSITRDNAADPTQVTSDVVGASEEGRILGTPAYMSPEQARGVPVDKRADIWAFGCVLFEMLAGKQPFDGATVTDTLARILEREPDWTLLPAETPLVLRTLLGRCLRKDRQKRLRDISDALIELEDAPVAGDGFPLIAASGRPNVAMMALVAGAVVLAAALAGLMIWNGRPSVGEGRAVKRIPIDFSTAPLLRDLDVEPGTERPFALSQDGRYLVYIGRPAPSAEPQLIVRALDELNPTPLAGTTGARHPFFSPDGQWIGYWSPEGAWKKVSRTGGASRELWRSSAVSKGGAWLPDNTVIISALTPAAGLMQVSADGGQPKVLTRPGVGETGHHYPVALPGGHAVLFTVSHRDNVEGDVAVLELASGRIQTLIKGGGYAEYVSAGYIVYSVTGTLRAQRFDLDTLKVIGDSVTIVEGVRTTREGEAAFALASGGTLIYSPSPSAVTARRSMLWVDRSGREQPIAAPARAYAHPRLSHDDSKLAVAARDETADLWVWDFSRPTGLIKLTSGPASDINPVWLPGDEELLLASRDETAISNILRLRADGSGRPTAVTSGPDNYWPISITPDGAQTIAVILRNPAPMQLATVHLDGSGRVERLLGGSSRVINGELSPTGEWLAYQSNETAREEIYVSPFPNVTGARTWIGAGTQPAWCRTGQQLFYLDHDGYLTEVTFEAPGFHPGISRRVLERRYGGWGLGRNFDVARDCQRFVVFKEEGNRPTDAPLGMVLLLDWLDELKRRLSATR